MFILSDPIPLRSKGGRIDKGDITKSVCAYVRMNMCCVSVCVNVCVVYMCVCMCVCVQM